MAFKEPVFHGEKPAVETEYPDRAVTESELALALAAAGGIDATHIEIVAADDGIHLKGTVTSEEETDKCLVLARRMNVGIINELSVAQPGRG